MKIKLQTAIVGCSFVFLALTSCIKENWGGVSIVTGTPYNITTTTATFNCSIESDGGSTITQRGVCISQSLNPTVADSTILVGEGLGSYIVTATGL